MSRLDKLEKEVSCLSNKVYDLSNNLNETVEALKSNKQSDEQHENKPPPENRVGVIDDESSDVQPVEIAKKRPTGKFERISTVGESFLLHTTIHGVSNATSTKSLIVRILWLIMIIFTATICIDTIYKEVSKYLENEVVTNTSEVEEETVTFPSLIICAQTKDNLHYLNAIENCTFNTKECTIPIDFDLFSSDRQIGQLTFDCLRFNGYQENGQSGELKEVHSEADDQLRITLSENNSGISNGFRFSGAKLLFVVQDRYLNTLEHSKYYWIERDDVFNVYVTRTVDEKLGEPYNHCQKMNETYRQLNCIEKCQHENVGAEYNCSLRGYYRMKEYGSICANQSAKNQFHDKCKKNCPKECDHRYYGVSILPKHVKQGEEGKVKIVAAFQTMIDLRLSQFPKTSFWDLLSSLGGTLGFLGMSFLTFVELFEFVFELFISIFS